MATCTPCGTGEGLYLYNTGRIAQTPVRLPQALAEVMPAEIYMLTHPGCGWWVTGVIAHGFLLPFLDAEPIQELRGSDADVDSTVG